MRLTVLVILLVLALAAFAQAQTFTVLYNFTGGSDGSTPDAGVIQDPAGNLYGTTAFSAGLGGAGVVFKLDPEGDETVLHSFSGGSNGGNPVAPLVRDKAGNLYGTAALGGKTGGSCSTLGCGVIFKLNPSGRETVLHRFTGQDGCHPAQGLIRDNAGNLYGTTSSCGSSGDGTIFKIDSAGHFTLLHRFARGPLDGGPAYGHLTMDTSGSLYGVFYGGVAPNNGVLYKLSKSGTFSVLYSFAGGTKDGCFPYGSVLLDKAGNLYGTTQQCGSKGWGIIWRVSQSGKETILHNFTGGKSDGCFPTGGVTPDSKGNLYGVAIECGAFAEGALFELSPKGKLTLLHSFDGLDGDDPIGEVLQTTKGTLFGTTYTGGKDGAGTVWSFVP